jgi:hypothetical protein
VVVGVVASIGFTVSLFFATAAFPEGPALAETKMGALLSFLAAPLAGIASRVIRVRSCPSSESCGDHRSAEAPRPDYCKLSPCHVIVEACAMRLEDYLQSHSRGGDETMQR